MLEQVLFQRGEGAHYCACSVRHRELVANALGLGSAGRGRREAERAGAGPPGRRQCAWADILRSDRPPSVSAVVGKTL